MRKRLVVVVVALMALSMAPAAGASVPDVQLTYQEAVETRPGHREVRRTWALVNNAERALTGVTVGFHWANPPVGVTDTTQDIRLSSPLAAHRTKYLPFERLALPRGFTGVFSVDRVRWSRAIAINGRIQPTDVAPSERGGRTFVPVSYVARALGASVEWVPAWRSVIIRRAGDLMELRIGSTLAMVNGYPLELDVEPFVYQGRTMMPLRFIAEQLGAEVAFDQAANLVSIKTKAASGAEDEQTTETP